VGLAGARAGVAAQAHIQSLALLHRTGQGAHGLFQGRVGVKAVAVKDVHIVQPHALQALVQAGQQVFARAATAIRPGPHVVAGLAADDQLVAVGLEVAQQVAAKVALGAAGRRAVVVGQVKVGDAGVKGQAQHVALGLQGCGITEVVPQAQRDGGQLQPTAAAAAVSHALIVALGVGLVGHLGCAEYMKKIDSRA